MWSLTKAPKATIFTFLFKAKPMCSSAAMRGPERVAGIEGLCSFGEEALISNARRNASIRMAEDGVVIRLSKDDFNTYIKEPMLKWLSPLEAKSAWLEGKVWLDARDEQEYKKGHMRSAVSLPLGDLREKVSTTLSKETSYICYCDQGRRSSTAAFLLRQRGYDVAVLRGGLNRL